MAVAADAEPIVPPSLIFISSTKVTIPSLATVMAVAADAEPMVPPSLIFISSTKVTIPLLATVMAVVADAAPMVPPSGITNAPEPPFSVNTPVELSFIFSAAASEAAVLKLSLVALFEELKSPSDTASIPAATNLESVSVPSSGAWKLIVPRTSFAAISVSPV